VSLILHLQTWLRSFLFLLVFFDSQAGISLLGEVNRATPVDNQRRRGAAIAGFGTCCSEAGSICVKPPPNRRLSEPLGRSGPWFTSSGIRFQVAREVLSCPLV